MAYLREKPREARDLIFKIRSYSARSDLKNKQKTAEKYLIFKIRSYSARSDLKNKIPRFSGGKNVGSRGSPPSPDLTGFDEECRSQGILIVGCPKDPKIEKKN